MQGRLLPFAAGASAWNMAVDQAILESVEESAIPTLRFYGWLEPTLSLGYFQAYQSRFGHSASSTCACVRRATGGGAILHDHELTYSLVMPMAASATQTRQRLYRDVHLAIVRSLADVGVRATPYRLDGRPDGRESALLCFQRRTEEDLIVSGYKIVGSAQRRSRGAVLQHGSVLLRASRCAPELPGVFELTSQQIDAMALVGIIAEHLGGLIGVAWEPAELRGDERDNGKRIEAERFATVDWNRRR